MTTLTTNDLRDALYEAQEHLYEAIRLIETYVSSTGDENAEAYLLDHLRIFAGRGHGYLSRDLNIDDLIARLDDIDEDEEEDDPADGAPPPVILSPAGHNRYWCNSLGGYVTIPTDED